MGDLGGGAIQHSCGDFRLDFTSVAEFGWGLTDVAREHTVELRERIEADIQRDFTDRMQWIY